MGILQEFTATSTQKGESLETIVKAAYGTKNYKLASSILPDGKVSFFVAQNIVCLLALATVSTDALLYFSMQALLSITAKNLAPNLTAVLSGTLPDEQSGKVGLHHTSQQLFLYSAPSA